MFSDNNRTNVASSGIIVRVTSGWLLRRTHPRRVLTLAPPPPSPISLSGMPPLAARGRPRYDATRGCGGSLLSLKTLISPPWREANPQSSPPPWASGYGYNERYRSRGDEPSLSSRGVRTGEPAPTARPASDHRLYVARMSDTPLRTAAGVMIVRQHQSRRRPPRSSHLRRRAPLAIACTRVPVHESAVYSCARSLSVSSATLLDFIDCRWRGRYFAWNRSAFATVRRAGIRVCVRGLAASRVWQTGRRI